SNLPGRHWLGFENAEYTLQPERGGTLLTRTTTITSGLSPSWYWEPLERWGVASEHRYLFQDVERKINDRYFRSNFSNSDSESTATASERAFSSFEPAS